MDAAQSQYICRTRLAPEHARLFAARPDHGLATGLDDSRADKEPLLTKGAVLHSFDIVNEVAQFLVNLLILRLAAAFLSGILNQIFVTTAHLAPDPACDP